jgi:hypothetical protein
MDLEAESERDIIHFLEIGERKRERERERDRREGFVTMEI